MGIGRTVKNMIHPGNQTTTPSTDSNLPFISDGKSGGHEPGEGSNFRSQFDRKDDIDHAFGSNGQTRSLESDHGNGMYGETMIPANKTHEIGNASGPSESGGVGKRGTFEADYGNQGTGLTSAITGTQHQRHTSDLGGTSFGGGPDLNSPADQTVGHREHTMKPTENVTDENHQLDSDTNENITQRETEAGFREPGLDQTMHHVVQHNAQFATDDNVRDDVHRDKINTITNARETPDGINVEMRGQPHQHNDPREVSACERAVIDKGESVNEREIHHVHHIIQPVINKETIEQHRIHTTIPIHQVTHEAPIVHKSQIHAPVSMEHFAQRGGQIAGGLTYDQIGSTVLRSGECIRQVDGEGDTIARELTGSGLPEAGGHFGRHTGENRPGLGKERHGEQDQGVLHSGPLASSSGISGISTSLNKRGKSTSMMYRSHRRPMDSYGGHSNGGLNDTEPITSDTGAEISRTSADA